MLRVEVTIEPFVEGQLGAHVTQALDAVRGHGCTVDIGPFGSTFEVDESALAATVGDLLTSAYAHGATHVYLHVEVIGP